MIARRLCQRGQLANLPIRIGPSVLSQQFVYENWLNQSDRQLTPARLFTGPAVYGWEQKGKIGQEGIHALPEAGV